VVVHEFDSDGALMVLPEILDVTDLVRNLDFATVIRVVSFFVLFAKSGMLVLYVCKVQYKCTVQIFYLFLFYRKKCIEG